MYFWLCSGGSSWVHSHQYWDVPGKDQNNFNWILIICSQIPLCQKHLLNHYTLCHFVKTLDMVSYGSHFTLTSIHLTLLWLFLILIGWVTFIWFEYWNESPYLIWEFLILFVLFRDDLKVLFYSAINSMLKFWDLSQSLF